MKQKILFLISGVSVLSFSLIADENGFSSQMGDSSASGALSSEPSAMTPSEGTVIHEQGTISGAATSENQQPVVEQWNTPAYPFDTQGDEARGDWYKKRKTLQQARPVHEQIHQVVKNIDEVQRLFIEKYAPAAQRLTQAVESFGFSLQEVQEVAHTIDASIAEHTQAEGVRNEGDRQKLIDLQDSKKMIDEFTKEFKYLLDLYESLNKSLDQLKRQVAQANEYEQKAWKNYEAIDEVFNDKTASRLLNEMRAYLENAQMIEAYIKNDLNNHCQIVIDKFEEQLATVKKLLELVSQRGITFKKAVEQVPAPESTQPETVKTEKVSWWSKIGNFFVSIWNWFIGLFIKKASA